MLPYWSVLKHYKRYMAEKRLNKILQEFGVASRRKADELIAKGLVQINGKRVLELGIKADPNKDEISVSGKTLTTVEKKIYLMLNKPIGYVCSNKRIFKEKLVLDLLPQKERLFTIGRLDKETSGLLLVTNDGDFANLVIHPSSNISKEYIATLADEIKDIHIDMIYQGVDIDNRLIKPKLVEKIGKKSVKVVVNEGKKHEVRKLIDNTSIPLIHLKRTRIGKLALNGLQEGDIRDLSEIDKAMIFE